MRFVLQPYEICNYLNCKQRFTQTTLGFPNECMGTDKQRRTKFSCDIDDRERGEKCQD